MASTFGSTHGPITKPYTALTCALCAGERSRHPTLPPSLARNLPAGLYAVRFREIERIEERLLADIPLVGFRTATYEVHLLTEGEMLEDKLRKNRQLLFVVDVEPLQQAKC